MRESLNHPWQGHLGIQFGLCMYFLDFFTLFLHCCLCIWHFIAWNTGINLRSYGSLNWSLSLHYDLHDLSVVLFPNAFSRLVGYNDACATYLERIRIVTSSILRSCPDLAKHCCWHRNFQLSPCVSLRTQPHPARPANRNTCSTSATHGVARAAAHDNMDPPLNLQACSTRLLMKTAQPSNVFMLRFRDSPLLFFFSLRYFWHVFPHIWPQTIGPGCRFVSLSTVLRTMFSHLDVFLTTKQWFVCIQSTNLIALVFHRYSSVQFDSRFNVVTEEKVPWDGKEIIPSITIIPRWVSMWGWRRPVWFASKIILFSSSDLGCPGLKWMLSDPDLLHQFWMFHLRLVMWNFHLSLAFSLPLHWVTWHFRCVHLSRFSPQCLRPQCLLSRFSTRTKHNRRIVLKRLSCGPRQVFGRNAVTFDHRAKTGLFVLWMVRQIAIKVFSHQTKDLVRFEDGSSTPWNPPTIFCPDLIATGPQMFPSLILRTTLSAIAFVSERWGVDAQWFQKRSSQDLPILRNCQCKWLLVSSLTPRTFVNSFLSPEKFSFHMGMIVSTEWPRLVPPQCIDCFEIHILHWELCDPQSFWITKIFRSGHDCTSAEAQTQPAGLDTDVDNVEVEKAEMAGHCVKRLAEAASEDGGPEGRLIQIDDCENTTLKVKLQGMDLMKRAIENFVSF